MIRDYDINYKWSAYNFLQKKNQNSNDRLLGFAPEYSDLDFADFNDKEENQLNYVMRSGPLPLPGAKKELEAIQDIWPTKSFFGSNASEARFKELSDQYGVLHFSMHALLNEKDPPYSSLVFSNAIDSIEDGQLHAWEIYNMDLNADLAVLSACNTGYGQIQSGEGVVSLSRAFAYAGVPNTIMSLWRVPDQSTSKIMTAFYKNLRSGDLIDEAISRSKKDFLAQVITPQEAHPYYWAGFVHTGTNDPISSKSGLGLKWIGLGFLLLLVLFWMVKNRQS